LSRVTQCYNASTKFHTNLSTGSQVVNGTRTRARARARTHARTHKTSWRFSLFRKNVVVH